MRILTLSQLSLAGSSGIAEVKQPIWWADGTEESTSTYVSAGGIWLADGVGSKSSQTTLFTLSSNWPASMKFAFEGTLRTSTSGFTAYVEMWDVTSNSAVAGTQISTTSTTETIVRSGQFTLIPSHQYGVTFWISSTSSTVLITDASLIIFP